ncbi:MAG: hypothetical protein U9R72_02840 [Chloroflexota bacterium]|nr:hypothetical protein [Chloroflexota bacterium]
MGKRPYIHVRLRVGRDDDIARWYKAQPNKSQAIREAVRAYIDVQEGNGKRGKMREMVESVVREVVADELRRLPDATASVVRDVLNECGVDRGEACEAGGEDAELAARLDEQLDVFFGGK